MFKKDVEKVVSGDTSGNYQALLLALLVGRKPASGVDTLAMNNDIDTLYRATEGKIGTDEVAMINILSVRSAEHLSALNAQYVTKSKGGNKTFSDVIKAETSGNFCMACLALMATPAMHLATQINVACKGVGTDERTLSRSLLLPDAYGVQEIVNIMRTRIHRDLVPLIRSEISGNYQVCSVCVFFVCILPHRGCRMRSSPTSRPSSSREESNTQLFQSCSGGFQAKHHGASRAKRSTGAAVAAPLSRDGAVVPPSLTRLSPRRSCSWSNRE